MARASVIHAAGKAPIPTPAPSLVTSRGQLPNLPTQLLERCSVADDPPLLFQVPLVDWFCLNSNRNILGADVVPDCSGDKGLQSFAALPSCVTMLAARTAGSSEFITTTPGKLLAVSTESTSGRPVIKPHQVVDLQKCLKTDFFESPSDAPPLLSVSKRGIGRSVDRAFALLNETLLELGAHGNGERQHHQPHVYIPVQGGVDMEQRTRAALIASKTWQSNPDQIAGFTVAGLYAGEGPDERWRAIEAVVKELPSEPLRVLAGGTGAPCDVLESVRRGVDIVESNYPFSLAAHGYALDLATGVKFNLRDRIWDTSRSPLLRGCCCIACQVGSSTGGFYTRSYIRHLLEVHEMLGETLLAAHNVRNYLDWFASLREAISGGRFDEFHAKFLEVREQARIEGKLSA